MADDPAYGSLPFEQAISHFRQKVNVPTARWADMVGGAHARAFTVAGATKEGMLTDFRTAIDKAISQGTTLETFRKNFDDIVAKFGWDYKGGRGWRTNVIYGTNMRTAYAAGRWQQMTDPDVVAIHPYWTYRHADGERFPRPLHQSWDGITLPVGSPWIATHACPNGWGCQCQWEPTTRDEVKERGKSGPDPEPPQDMRKATLNTSAGPVEIEVPNGVDPGWGHSIGEAAFGKQLPKATMDAWRAKGADAFERLTPGDWQSASRPAQIPIDKPAAAPGPHVSTVPEMAALIEQAIGGKEAAVELPDGETIYIDAAALAQHVDPNRSPYIAYLPELMHDPYEIWLSFEKHRGTGQVVLRRRIIKAIPGAGGDRGLVLVAQASRGMMETLSL